MHKQHEAIGHLIHLLKKPFSKSQEKEETAAPAGE